MGRTIGLITALCLIAIALAAYRYPGSPLFWNASTSEAFNIARCSISSILLVCALYLPKRRPLRILLGLSAFSLGVYVWNSINLGIIDILTLSAASISVLLALLESKPADEPFKSMEYVSVVRDILVERMRIISAWELLFAWVLAADLRLLLERHFEPLRSNARLIQSHN